MAIITANGFRIPFKHHFEVRHRCIFSNFCIPSFKFFHVHYLRSIQASTIGLPFIKTSAAIALLMAEFWNTSSEIGVR